MNTDLSFWETRWKEKQTGWDLGGPHPSLPRLFSELRSPGKVWVPGCGRGHDVAALARMGFTVLGTDISPTAIEEAQQAYGTVARTTFRISDLFNEKTLGPFDGIYDRAMLCALPPERQPDYLGVCAQNLKPGGWFASILFSRLAPGFQGGPPYSVDSQQITNLFNDWEITWKQTAVPPPHPSAIQEETLLIARKPLS